LISTANNGRLDDAITTPRCEGSITLSGDDILTTKQVVQEYPQFNYGTLRYWRSANEGPPSFTLGPRGRVVYRRSELEAWLAEVEQATRRGGGVIATTDNPAEQVTA
jgi:hypothetical protein